MLQLASCNERRVVLVSKNAVKVIKLPETAAKSVKVNRNVFEMNFLQEKMYNRLTKGIAYYTKEEISMLSYREIKQIEDNFEKSKFIIRKMKVDSYYKTINKLVCAIFSTYNIGSKMRDYYKVNVPLNITLKSLGITKKDVVDNFIEHRLLPSDFYSLSVENSDTLL
jgi:hypothetical protein